jgi:hypothetical protein
VAIVVLVVLAVMLLTALAAGLTAFGRARRSNRVCPDVDTGAPLHWLVWPTATARLHRRLRSAMVLAATARPAPPRTRWRRWRRSADEAPLSTLARQLEVHAVAIDRDLVLAARLRGPTRRAVLAPAARQVTTVERLATRLAAAARPDPRSPFTPAPVPAALERFDEDLRALEAARDEIALIEANTTAARLR